MYYAPCLYPQSTEGWPVSFVMKHLGSDHLPKSDLIVYMQRRGTPEWLRRWKLHGTTRNIKKNRNCKQLVAAYKVLTYCTSLHVHMYVCTYTDDNTTFVHAYGLSMCVCTWICTRATTVNSIHTFRLAYTAYCVWAMYMHVRMLFYQ